MNPVFLLIDSATVPADLKGIVTHTVVPRPGSGRMENWPLTSRTRSCIPSKPRRWFCLAESTLLAQNDFPLSAMTMQMPSVVRPMEIFTKLARACLATLVRLSCATRNSVVFCSSSNCSAEASAEKVRRKLV